MAIKAFISYSHADGKFLDRLHKHLAMLKREGAISTWTDHEILPGDNLTEKIDQNLEDSAIFIALLSADYLASSYCYEKEFKRAQELCSAGAIRIVPIIVEPCDWSASPFRNYLALPRDGKAVSEWTNQNNAFLDIVSSLRRLIGGISIEAKAHMEEGPFSRNVRKPKIKRDFDSIQKGEFADSAFDVLREYFLRSCQELNGMDDGALKAKFEKMGDAAFTATVVNRNRRNGAEAHITVRNNKGGGHFGDLNYVFERHAVDGTSNGSIRVEADNYTMYLVMDDFMRGVGDKFTPEQIAERLWIVFVQKVGIEYE